MSAFLAGIALGTAFIGIPLGLGVAKALDRIAANRSNAALTDARRRMEERAGYPLPTNARAMREYDADARLPEWAERPGPRSLN